MLLLFVSSYSVAKISVCPFVRPYISKVSYASFRHQIFDKTMFCFASTLTPILFLIKKNKIREWGLFFSFF